MAAQASTPMGPMRLLARKAFAASFPAHLCPHTTREGECDSARRSRVAWQHGGDCAEALRRVGTGTPGATNEDLAGSVRSKAKAEAGRTSRRSSLGNVQQPGVNSARG